MDWQWIFCLWSLAGWRYELQISSLIAPYICSSTHQYFLIGSIYCRTPRIMAAYYFKFRARSAAISIWTNVQDNSLVFWRRQILIGSLCDENSHFWESSPEKSSWRSTEQCCSKVITEDVHWSEMMTRCHFPIPFYAYLCFDDDWAELRSDVECI